MKLENEFTVNVPIERAWEVLTDIPEIAPCLPGAKLTGNDGDTYEGKVKIKVGPITAEYSGTAEFVEKNEATRHVVINAKGRDARGSGNASALITADMVPDGDGTRVSIDTDLKIAGKVAQFGKGVIGDVSKKLIDQFVDCVEAKLEDDSGRPAADIAAASASMATTVVGDSPAAEGGDKLKDLVNKATERAAETAKPSGAEEMEALDLMDAAGGAVAKRLVPVVLAVAAIVILYFLFR